MGPYLGGLIIRIILQSEFKQKAIIQLKPGPIVRKPTNSNPLLKINRGFDLAY